jgi:coenzyme F420-reducing hydrogenase beta subunit
MEEDEKGFLYPVINKEKCINCKQCELICPLADNNSKKLANKSQEDCYAFVSRDKEIFESSTSGGAFATIVNAYCDKDYIIFGVIFDENLMAIHSYIDNKSNVIKFGKSKYFQSQLGNTYKQIKSYLIEDKKVVFSGTPCQVAGLKAFLKKDYEKLLCVDVICYGVPSKKAFLSYKTYLEKRDKDELINTIFRVHNENYIINKYKNIGEKNSSCDSDFYMRAFNDKIMHRDCCKECQFTNINRQGDITIGDFWGIENFASGFNPFDGVSLLIFSTEKGIKLKEVIFKNNIVKSVPLKDVIKYNAFNGNDVITTNNFYEDLNNGLPFNEAVDKNSPK